MLCNEITERGIGTGMCVWGICELNGVCLIKICVWGKVYMCMGYIHLRYVYGVCELKVCVWGMFT